MKFNHILLNTPSKLIALNLTGTLVVGCYTTCILGKTVYYLS